MSHKDKSLDAELDNLYQAHKQNTQVPRYIKKQVMVAAYKKASVGGKTPWTTTSWFAAAASVFVFALLVNMFVIRKDVYDLLDAVALVEPKQKGHFAVEVVHRLDSEAPMMTAKNRRRKHLEKVYQLYEMRKATLEAYNKQEAQLVAVSNGWSLKTCDDEIVQISPQLVTLFVDWEQIEADIQLGDQVDIAFDSNGRITKISRISEVAQC
jgi:hypothetical protein